jgi:flavin reductase (DIM6/NTAB) family NADH-FMN oxidoreductase RutF
MMRTDLTGFLDGLDYPMFVVTAQHDGLHAGCLVGFTSQVSMEPARFLVCLSVENHTYDIARDASVLAVHLLGADQADLAAVFGSETGDEIDKFDRCRWHAGPDGIRVLTDAPAWMLGSVRERVLFGDHVGFLLDPLEAHREGGGSGFDMLTYQQVRGLSPGHPA